MDPEHQLFLRKRRIAFTVMFIAIVLLLLTVALRKFLPAEEGRMQGSNVANRQYDLPANP